MRNLTRAIGALLLTGAIVATGVTPASADEHKIVILWRLQNTADTDYEYTTDQNEIDAKLSQGYRREGSAGRVFTQYYHPEGTIRFYQWYSAEATDHLYTTEDRPEPITVDGHRYVRSNVDEQLYALPAGSAEGRPLVELYKHDSHQSTHFYTVDEKEIDAAVSAGYRVQGTIARILPPQD
ncbi:hypothetical protein D5S17_27310 [Pseudonocardiaceae bacterium YIM PH 21723]|nr:hypothetical protein D5S17_27310 [Pseudonocardiaceae bacterium YIM PH 21723]